MSLPRKYAVNEVSELVELFREDPETSREKFAGMRAVVELLAFFENMTEADIEAYIRENFHK